MKKSKEVKNDSEELLNLNNNNLKSFAIFCNKYILLITGIIVLIIGVFAFIFTAYFEGDYMENLTENTLYRVDNPILTLIWVVVSILILFLLCIIFKKIKTRNIFIMLLLISITIQFLWIFEIRLLPIYDQYRIVCYAESLLDGNLEGFSSVSSYFGMNPHQLGFIYFVAFVIKIVGKTDYLVLQSINVICSTINLILMYLIIKKLFNNDKVIKIGTFILFGFSMYFVFFNTHIYGNIIGLTFALIALLFTLKYFENYKIRYLALIALNISISIILKSNYSIFLCGIIICLFLDFLKNKKLRTIIGCIGIVLFYMFASYMLKFSLSLFTKEKIPEGIPKISFVYMGMGESNGLASGWWNEATEKLYEANDYNTQKTQSASIIKIKERLSEFASNPKMFFSYFSDKLASTWLNPTYQTIFLSSPGYQMQEWEYFDYFRYVIHNKVINIVLREPLCSIEEQFFNILQIIIFIFAFYGIFKVYKNNEIKHLLLPIIFLGGFAFHILWETKAIYVLQYYYLLVPYACFGIHKIFERIEIKNEKNISSHTNV